VENNQNYCHRISYFKAVTWFQLCCRPHWGSLRHFSRPPSWNLGGPASKGRGVGGKGKRKGGQNKPSPQLTFLAMPRHMGVILLLAL